MSSTILQLNPPLAVTIEKTQKRGYVYLYIDYSTDLEFWGVVDNETGELWFKKTSDIRFDTNISMGRIPIKP